MKRTFKVAESKNLDKRVTKLFVTDAEGMEELTTRPHVAEFPVSERYDEGEQEKHAQMFADFMNKIQEAKQQVYEQNMLMDILNK